MGLIFNSAVDNGSHCVRVIAAKQAGSRIGGAIVGKGMSVQINVSIDQIVAGTQIIHRRIYIQRDVLGEFIVPCHTCRVIILQVLGCGCAVEPLQKSLLGVQFDPCHILRYCGCMGSDGNRRNDQHHNQQQAPFFHVKYLLRS